MSNPADIIREIAELLTRKAQNAVESGDANQLIRIALSSANNLNMLAEGLDIVEFLQIEKKETTK